VLPVNFVTQRYLHDFFPLLVLAGAFGLQAVLVIRRTGLRAAVHGSSGVQAGNRSVSLPVGLAQSRVG